MDTNNNNQFNGFNQQQFNQYNQQQADFNQQQTQQYNQFNQQQQYGQNQYNQQNFTQQQQFNNIPQQKNTLGTIAFVLALISIFCCGGVFSIASIIVGIISLIKVGKNGKSIAAIILSIISLVVWIILYIVLGAGVLIDFAAKSGALDDTDYSYDYTNATDTEAGTEVDNPEVTVTITNQTESFDTSEITNFPVEFDKIGLIEFTTPDGINYTIDLHDMSTILNCDLLREDENRPTTLDKYSTVMLSLSNVNGNWDSFSFLCYNPTNDDINITEMKARDISFDGLDTIPYFKIDGFIDNTITEEQFLELMGEPSQSSYIDKDTNYILYNYSGNDKQLIHPTETSDCQILASFKQGKLKNLSIIEYMPLFR